MPGALAARRVPAAAAARAARRGAPVRGARTALRLSCGASSPRRRAASAASCSSRGEPGIGKTSLGAAFASEAYEAGAIVLYGRADEETLVPYQPFVDVISISS